jgi:type IV fimbrial biogenesis protein FimT
MLPNERRASGFTLLEAIFVMAIVAIALAAAAPTLRDTMSNMRMAAQSSDLVADLALARSEAVKRNVQVFICASNDGARCAGTDWRAGWVIFPDADGVGVPGANESPLIKVGVGFSPNTTVATGGVIAGAGDIRYIAYRPSGAATLNNVSFNMCDGRTGSRVGRSIQITPTGRTAVTRIDC